MTNESTSQELNTPLAQTEEELSTYKQALILLAGLGGEPPSRELSEALKLLRRQLMQDASLEEITQSIQVVRRTSRLSGAPDPLEVTEDSQTEQHDQEKVLEHVRGVYVELLSNISVDLNDAYRKKANTLHSKIQQCQELELLLALSPKLEELTRLFADFAFEERRNAQLFVKEVLANLAELKRFAKKVMGNSISWSKSSKKFNDTLDTQVQGVTNSVNIINDLTELKKVVMDHMESVKKALERKRQGDETRLVETKNELVGLRDELQNITARMTQVQQENRELTQKVQTDPLTGVNNRMAFDKRLTFEIARAKRYSSISALVMLDIDHFKRINDNFGHVVGDKCLIEVARRLRNALRETDFIGRYGGEEFAAILHEVDLDQALAIAEKLRSAIEQTEFTVRGKDVPITISCGMALIKGDLAPDEVTNVADTALYKAKESGRNKVMAG